MPASSFRRGAREGFLLYLPLSVGLIPWGLVMGMALVSGGLTPLQVIGMNLLIFAGTAQLGTLSALIAQASGSRNSRLGG
jgi:predicted branched-subunit amino acid permease